MIRAVARDTLVYGLAAIVSRGLSLLALPVYTRILAPSDYGAVDMIMVVAALATLVVALEITQALARLYHDAETAAAKRLMASTALWFTAFVWLLAFVVGMIFSRPLAGWVLGSEDLVSAFRIGIGYIAINGLFYFAQNQLRFDLRPKAYAVISLMYAFVTVALGVLLGFWLSLGLQGVLWAQLIAAGVSAIAGLWVLRSSFGFIADLPLLRQMLLFSLPLVPSGLATFITLYANRLALNDSASLAEVGLFGVATRIASVVTLLVVGIQSALTPLIYRHYKEPDTPVQLARITHWFIAIALLACLALGLFAREIITLFATQAYADAVPLVLPLAVATLLSQMYIFFPGIAISKKTHLQLLIFIVSGTTSAVLNWLLVDAFGLAGAAAATLLVGIAFFMPWAIVSQWLYPLPIRWGVLATTAAIFAACAVAGYIADWALGISIAAVLVKLGLVALLAAGCVVSGLTPRRDLARAFSKLRGRLRGLQT